MANFKGGLLCVFIFGLCILFTVGINVKSKFVVRKNKCIGGMAYREAVAQSLTACSAICQSSSNCTAANYFAETMTCNIFNKACFLTEDASGWTYLTRSQANRTFHHITEQKTWGEAKSHCESMGGNLANIYNHADYDMISSTLDQYPAAGGVWLGGSDISTEGEWIWSNGCRFNDQDFHYWYPGEPNNDGNQDCLRLWDTGGVNTWDDAPCTILLNFVCEIIA